ncbi:MAG: imidazoleglycerol-phosphate dehydratase HisB [Chloroflexi bacterium]|nr:imidazoleglycerol-phosphate dehydratase HisB [Chloroflexota bacterium]
MPKRRARLVRETAETNVTVELDIDGSGRFEITTGVSMLDHLLTQLAQHGLLDIKLAASGSDQHHVVEDVAITLGRAFNEAIGKKEGICRMGYAFVPMDEALSEVVVDVGGRPYSLIDITFSGTGIGDLCSDLIRHFLASFASEARINLHARTITGIDDHHRAEALFKALGRALDSATRIDDRLASKVPSTKGTIDA